MDEIATVVEPPSIGRRLQQLEQRLELLLSLHGSLPDVSIVQLRDLKDRVAAEAMMRARCMAVQINATTALCRILGRYKMYLDSRDSVFAPHLMFDGFCEYWLTEFIWRNVQPGQVVVDVGANHGYYSILMADLVGSDGLVHAFEPNPRMVQLLRRTVQLNGFRQAIKVHPVALAAASGVPAGFLAPEAEPQNGRLLREDDAAAARADAAAQVFEVPVRSLDDAIRDRVDVIKIDVGGAEEMVWQGMQCVIDNNPRVKVVMRFNPARWRTPAETLREVAARLPLREIGHDGRVHQCLADEVSQRRGKALLYLSSIDPE